MINSDEKWPRARPRLQLLAYRDYRSEMNFLDTSSHEVVSVFYYMFYGIGVIDVTNVRFRNQPSRTLNNWRVTISTSSSDVILVEPCFPHADLSSFLWIGTLIDSHQLFVIWSLLRSSGILLKLRQCFRKRRPIWTVSFVYFQKSITLMSIADGGLVSACIVSTACVGKEATGTMNQLRRHRFYFTPAQ